MTPAPERISTTYSLPIDRSTVELLAGAPLGKIEDVGAIQFIRLDPARNRLIYVVPWESDNEYVHKTLKKNLRIWIKALQRVSGDRE